MHKKTIYIILIVAGTIILFYSNKSDDTILPYLSVFGFVILMFGLYKVSTVLVKNRSDNENDDL